MYCKEGRRAVVLTCHNKNDYFSFSDQLRRWNLRVQLGNPGKSLNWPCSHCGPRKFKVFHVHIHVQISGTPQTRQTLVFAALISIKAHCTIASRVILIFMFSFWELLKKKKKTNKQKPKPQLVHVVAPWACLSVVVCYSTNRDHLIEAGAVKLS